jgi:hypothetical protein
MQIFKVLIEGHSAEPSEEERNFMSFDQPNHS